MNLGSFERKLYGEHDKIIHQFVEWGRSLWVGKFENETFLHFSKMAAPITSWLREITSFSDSSLGSDKSD